MRCRVLAWAWVVCGSFAPLAMAAAPAFDIGRLDPAAGDVSPEIVAGGALDSRFGDYSLREVRRHGGPFWLRLTVPGQDPTSAQPSASARPATGAPALILGKGHHLQPQLYFDGAPLPAATTLPEFSAVQSVVYALPRALAPGDVLYAHFDVVGEGSEVLRFETGTLAAALARGAEHTRMVALAFGALLAVAVAALLIWFVLKDRLFILYAALFSLQALYIAYLSGEGFAWPLLSVAAPLNAHAWNVPAALSGAAACLFVREIADLRRYSYRVYRIYGWLAVIFVLLAFSNVATWFNLGGVVAAIGNLLFIGTAVFTLVVAFLAWRRGSRPAGWFLLAWVLLEAFTIATALRLLSGAEDAHFLMYYGLPLSMVAAAILIALGVADRLREQRVALSEAERHAQTDALTGVLNRRSLIERLEVACARARARGLPIALLFIDLDHFKEINDTWGHPAGDACLAAIIPPIQAELRQSDVVGRYGGEEFVVILSSADAAAAQPIAQRIRERVAAVAVEGFGAPIKLTCSIGVATSDTLGVWGEHLIAHADAAVYAAKRAGRNRVQVAPPLAA